jgi:rhamnose transport system permease protein
METTAKPPSSAAGSALLAILGSPEWMVGVLLVLALAFCAATEPYFRNAGYLFDRSSLVMETGVMAVGMTFVIIGGHIDLSCASMLALVGAVVASLSVSSRVHIPFLVLVLLAPVLGAILGGVNGIIVAKLRLPSLVVTLATMAVYRGLAQALIGDHSVSVPDWFTGIDQMLVGPTPVAMPMVIFLSLAVALGLVLHRTVAGRWVFAMGTNSEAALYAGVPVAGVTVGCFVLSGVLSAVAALMMMSRLGNARFDHAQGAELDVITAVVLGGASIFGGRGTMFGTVLAMFLLFVLQTGMGVHNIKSEYQLAAIGGLLIFAVLASNGLAWLRGK